MVGITLARRKYGDLDKFAEAVRTKMGKRILNLMAESLSEHVKKTQLSGQALNSRSGKTRESMGFYQLKRGKGAAYVIRPGRNIEGRLNYLGGMSRGMLITPKRGEFIYIRDESGKITAKLKSTVVRARPFMVPGWKSFKATGNVRRIMTSVYSAYAQREFKNDGGAEA